MEENALTETRTPNHSIVVLTYNQEDLIEETLDSIYSQRPMPDEVIISDDNSSDNSWKIICEYKTKYPEITKIYRNTTNIGIYPHFNKSLTYPTGDFINYVSGDDILPPNILCKYNEFIDQFDLGTNESFLILTDSLLLLPNREKILKVNNIDQPHCIERLLLQSIYAWETGISRGLLNRLKQIGYHLDLGIQADAIWNLDKFLSADKIYYINAPGYIYRVDSGITKQTKLLQHLESSSLVNKYRMENYPMYMTDKVIKYTTFDLALQRYYAYPSFSNYVDMLKRYIAYRYRYSFPVNNRFRHSIGFLVPVSIKKLIRSIKN